MRIQYKGDRANESGYGEALKIEGGYKVKMDDGRVFPFTPSFAFNDIFVVLS